MSDEQTQLKAEIEQVWSELKLLMQSMEEDLAKSLNGVGTATTRARKGLSLMRKNAQLLRISLLELRKVKADAKKKG